MAGSDDFPAPPAGAPHESAKRCAECGRPLAFDQRYCLSCGHRQGPLPLPVALTLGALEGLSPADEPRGPGADVESTPDEDRWAGFLPTARAAAICLLLMVGLGSVVGAATSQGGVASLGRTIDVTFSPATHQATIAAATPSAGAGSGAGSGGASDGGGATQSAAAAPSAPSRTPTTRTVTLPAQTPTDTGSGAPTPSPTTPSASALPPIQHVWEIVLSGQGYAQSFGDPGDDPYLARTLVSQGELISNYDAVAGSPLANEVALISGQGPTPATLQDCPSFDDLASTRTGRHGQVIGDGCVYPTSAETLGTELTIFGLRWRAYIEGIGTHGQTHRPKPRPGPPATTGTAGTTSAGTTTSTNPAATGTAPAATSTTPPAATSTTPAATSAPGSSTTTSSTTSGSPTPAPDTSRAPACPHPASGASDPDATATRRNHYVTSRNPWVYFHSVIDHAANCRSEDVGLDQLAHDLRSPRATPAFSYIAPDPCDDGSSTPCRPGAGGGMRRADAFLKKVVPMIERSAAYRDDGLILVTFDEAPQFGPDGSTASCCDQPSFPNLPASSASSSTSTTASGTATSSTTTSSATSAATPTSGSPTTTGTPTTTATPPTTASPSASGTTPAACTSPTSPTSTSTSTSTSPAPSTPPSTTSATSTTSPASSTSATTSTSTSAACAPAIVGDPPGGGQVGLLMISPYVQPGKTDPFDSLDHFSLLKGVEQVFGLPDLGYAADPQLTSLTSSMFLAEKR